MGGMKLINNQKNPLTGLYRNAIVLLIFFPVISACTQKKNNPAPACLPYYNQPDFTPVWLAPDNDSVQQLHTISPFSFTNQNGENISQQNTDGKIYVANFFFTSCGSICPKMTEHLKKVQHHFAGRKDILFLMHSVTPWKDTVNRLKWYADKFELKDKSWHLLTGSQKEIYQLARQSYFAEEQAGFTRDSSEFIHSEHILLVDRHRHLRGIYNGTLELEADRMIADIELLLKE